MEPSLTRPYATNGAIQQSSPFTPASLSSFSDSFESHKSEASGTALGTPSTCREDTQDSAAGPDPVPERPVVPSCPADWEARKQTIRELYMDQNMILNEVIEIMLTKHKFKATY
jgi:hypothetical protein